MRDTEYQIFHFKIIQNLGFIEGKLPELEFKEF